MQGNIEVEYYNKLVTKYVFPPVCVECGESKNLKDEPPTFEGRKNRPLYVTCIALLDVNQVESSIERFTCENELSNMPPSSAPSIKICRQMILKLIVTATKHHSQE